MIWELALLELQDHVLDVAETVRCGEAQYDLPVPLQGDLVEVSVPINQ